MNTICKDPNTMTNQEIMGEFIDAYCGKDGWKDIPSGKIDQYKCG